MGARACLDILGNFSVGGKCGGAGDHLEHVFFREIVGEPSQMGESP